MKNGQGMGKELFYLTMLRFCCGAGYLKPPGNSKRMPQKHARTVASAGYMRHLLQLHSPILRRSIE